MHVLPSLARHRCHYHTHLRADLRIATCAGLKIDKSILTGEAEPVRAIAGPVGPKTGASMLNAHNMAFMGTNVTVRRGRSIRGDCNQPNVTVATHTGGGAAGYSVTRTASQRLTPCHDGIEGLHPPWRVLVQQVGMV